MIIDALLPLFSDSPSAVRKATARAFGPIIDESEDMRIITALLQSTHDLDRSVQEAAAFALAKARKMQSTFEQLKSKESHSFQRF